MKKRIVLRVFIFAAGLFIMALGVAFSVKADLGISPISCVPYILSLKYPFTIGQFTIVFNILVIVLQIAILRKNYKFFQLIQLPVIFLLGFFIDLAIIIISDLNVAGYISRLLLCIVSCIIIAFGVFLEIKAKITYLPGEGLALAVSETSEISFGKSKIIIDCSIVAAGILFSFMLHGKLSGVREGTIAAALAVGFIVKQLNARVKFFNRLNV